MNKFITTILVAVIVLAPSSTFASAPAVDTTALAAQIASLQAQLAGLQSVSSLTVQATAPTKIRFGYANLPAKTNIYLVSSMSPFKSYKMSTETGTIDSIVRSIPSSVLNLDSSTMYRLEARGANGVLAASEYFQTGGRVAGTPDCSMTASDYVVSGGEVVTLKWTSKNAVSVYKITGFPTDPQKSSLKKNGSLTVQPTISGNLVYALVFGADSGNQSICDVHINVSGEPQSGTFNQSSLETGSTRPVLSGTATNVKSVKVSIVANEKGGGLTWMSKEVPVRNGKWSVKVSPALTYENYTYGVELQAYDKGQYYSLATGKLYVE
jgi:hypothetical protein